MTGALPTGARAGIASCAACGLLSRPAGPGNAGSCPRCGEPLAFRRRDAVQRTWALVIAAAICYLPANTLPVMTTITLKSSEPSTIIGGVVDLYEAGSWVLASIVLIASVVIPLGKLGALAYLLATVRHRSGRRNRERTRLYRLLKTVGRWSMLDVFVATYVVALIRFQPFLSVTPGPGVPFFAAVVILTIFAADAFDPRLIWDSGGETRGEDD